MAGGHLHYPSKMGSLALFGNVLNMWCCMCFFFSFLNAYSFIILVKNIRKRTILLWVQMWTQSFFLAPFVCVHILWWFPVFYQVVYGTNSALQPIVGPKHVCVVISLNQVGYIKYILCLSSVVIVTEIFLAYLFHENGRKCTCFYTSRERITLLSHGICYFSLRS